jgi:hydroxyacylglutathione hydrolase
MLDIHQFPCLTDNYGVLIRDAVSGAVASIDAPKAAEVTAALSAKGWQLTEILTTHHHADHTDGNLALKAATACRITGPKAEAARIPGIDIQVSDGDTIKFGALAVSVIATPGHTSGHIIYWIPDAKVAFVGDTLFAMGCGRVNEGTMQQMWGSVSAVGRLPASTMLYCGHEYTLSNARFALTMEPENADLQARMTEVEALRAAGRPTLPTRVDIELKTNPFLRPGSAAIRRRLGLEGAEDWQVFAELRERKNRG